MNPQEYGMMKNFKLNLVIANDFLHQASNLLHYFRLGPGGKNGVAEIRGNSSSFFISAIKDETIDILTIQNSWLKPKYKGAPDNPIELGDT
jgi:hypothetical protein